jgi:RNase P protein component
MLREAARDVLSHQGKNHHDYVIIAKKEIVAASYEQILQQLNSCAINLAKY